MHRLNIYASFLFERIVVREKILRLSIQKILDLNDGACYEWTNAMVCLKGDTYFVWKKTPGKVEEYCCAFKLDELNKLFDKLKSMK